MKKLKKKKLEERKPELSSAISSRPRSSEAARMREATRKRRLFFERASRAAEAAYAKDPLDAENLTRWGGALLELAHCQDGPDSVEFVEGAISKLAEALKVERRKHDTLWCMGNAYTSLAFYTSDIEVANTYFAKATWCFEQACEEEPQNESYSRSFKFSLRTPELHPGLRTQMASEQASQGTSFTSSATSLLN